MSSLVSTFIIEPILRRARRFSYSRPTPNDSEAIPYHVSEKEMQANEANEPGEGSLLSEPIVSSPLDSPTEESGPPASTAWNRGNTEPALRPISRVPLRVASLRSDLLRSDDDTSQNPSFGTPSSFQTSTFDNVRMDSLEGSTHLADDETSSVHSRQGNSSLPEDDGMSELRRRIVAIQGMDSSSEEKARLMHNILTESYSQSQTHVHARPIPRSLSPVSIYSQGQPTTPGSASSVGIWPISITPNSSPPRVNAFNLSPEDLEPTFAPPKPLQIDDEEPNDENDIEEESPEPVLGCPHYRRNVKLQCSQCHGWYTCRFCHDEVESHALIRKDTKNMLCMLCGFPQPAGQSCIRCGEQAAWYYCSVCKLWDDDPTKSIYHCDDCGICRVGRGLGKDFIHCKTCGVCMSIAIENSHKCIERSTDCDCPICGDYMFSSPQTVVFMKCGHSIHHKCYYEHMQSSYKCPICSKSIVNMETQFRNLDRAIDNQPMPPQFQDTKAMVHCNDCYAKSAVKYHWLGLKCAICDSYNTAQLQILSDPEVPCPVGSATGTPESQLDRQTPNLDPLPAPVNQHLMPSNVPTVRRYSDNTPGPASRLDTYPIPQRMSRSVSPSRDFGILSSQETNAADSEDDMDFWGYHRGPRLPENAVESDDDEDGDEDEYESEVSDTGDFEEDDEGDEMELFGHR